MDVHTINEDYREKYGFHVSEKAVFRSAKGLTETLVREISAKKGEPDWMLQRRLSALKIFQARKLPAWGADLSTIDFEKITYYLKSSDESAHTWEDVPEHIKQTFDRLGIPEAERRFLGGVGAQFESESVYHKLRGDLEKRGVIFCDMDTALREHPELVKEHFCTIVPAGDNMFAALNTAVWSGGSFIYVPPGVNVEIPLQAYFRINAKNMGQFERTMIIVDKNASVHYIEGCSAPIYSTSSLHAAVVEAVVLEGARLRYTTIQNWSSDVYNLVTKRAVAHKDALVEWIDGNIGSKTTMKYPAVILKGERARADIMSIAFAGAGQHQDAGAKVTHLAPFTTSRIISKSVSKDGGRSSYRGLVRVCEGAHDCTTSVKCDALLLDDRSRSDTYPTMQVEEEGSTVAHEASVGKIGEDELFYLMQRGMDEDEARALIVLGFIAEFTKQLPLEYSIELNKLIELEMEGSVA